MICCVLLATRLNDASNVAANVFGRDEDNPFEFARKCTSVALSAHIDCTPLISLDLHLRLCLTEGDIDGLIGLDAELLRGGSGRGFFSVWPMASNRCRGLLSLCVNDAAKEMLLSNAGFVPLLIDGAF